MDALKYRSEPRYATMANALRERIRSGELKPGDRLPSFPAMRAQGVSQPTLDRVLGILEIEGLIRREPKRGVFVAEPKPHAAPSILGVVLSMADDRDPYYALLLKGMQIAAHRHSLEILLLQETSAVPEGKVGGLIICGSYFQEQVPLGLPIVFALSVPAKGNVTANDYQGTRDAMEYLLNLGHRRIGILSSGFNVLEESSSRARGASYRAALKAAGIVLEKSWIRQIQPWLEAEQPGGYRGQGYRRMNEWLRNGWSDLGCTALLGQNDDAAIGMIEALQEAGYRVPHDVSVIGFDGNARAEYFSPRLTTVHVPLQSIGEASVELLCKLMEPRGNVAIDSNHHVVFPTELRIGASTAPPPR